MGQVKIAGLLIITAVFVIKVAYFSENNKNFESGAIAVSNKCI